MPRPRLIPIVSSFAIVLMAYWVYAMGVVRLIEPEAGSRVASDDAGGADLGTSGPRGLEEHFPPGAWELDKPKILESRQVMLLFGDYTNFDTKEDQNKVLLHPCTMVFTQEEPGLSFAEQNRRAVILEAPQGALLEFDQPLDLCQAKIGRLVSGLLRGPVVIRSRGKLPGPEDDLRIETSDVELNEKQVSTPEPVRFRWGANRGSGRGLLIELVSDKKARGHGPNVTDIKSLQLQSVERVHLEFPKKDVLAAKTPAAGTPPATPSNAGRKKDTSELPVEITCHGPFRFVRQGEGKGSGEKGKKGGDAEENVAYFEDHVDVWRIHPDGPLDHLSCERLAIYLGPRKKPRPASGKGASEGKGDNPLDLEPQRIVATGNPVVVHAPGESVHARGRALEYILADGRISLSGGEEAMLQQGPNEIHVLRGPDKPRMKGPNGMYAPALDYQPDPSGRLGEVWAIGPGWLVGQSPDRPDDQLEARWNQHLHVYPDKENEQNQVIALIGATELYFRGVGRLTAGEIFFWLIEKPGNKKSGDQKSDRPTLQPDRMLARKNVQIHHPQLDGSVQQMEVWFEQLPPAAPGPAPQGPVAVDDGPGGDRPTAHRVPRVSPPDSCSVRYTRDGATRMIRLTTDRQGNRPGQTPLEQARPPLVPPRQVPTGRVPAGPAAPGQARPDSMPLEDLPPGGQSRIQEAPGAYPPGLRPPQMLQERGETSPQHFNIVGDLLQSRIVIRGKKTELSELTVVGNVRLIETETQRPDEQPLLVTGDRLHVLDAGKPYAAVAVTGRLAHFEARGLALNGSNINLNRGTNRLWIDGPGWMDLPMDRDPQGRPVGDAGPLEIHWQDRMNFDGRTMRYEDSVVATSRFHHLRTETLEVTLSRKIRFAETNTNTNTRPEIQQIVCRGGAYMENRSADQTGQTSIERIRVADLSVNMASGALSAAGPGWVRTTRRGSPASLSALGGARAAMSTARRPAATDPADEQALTYVGVDFQGSLSGNLHRREMTFVDRVRTVYGPADSWEAVLDPDKPEELGSGGAVLNCDALTVAEMAVPNRKERAMELVATGNTLVEAASFTARASRLSYAEAKDLLILEGNGRTDAELFRQERIGAEMSRFSARKIFFWPSTNRLNIDSGSLVEVNESSQPKPKPNQPPPRPPQPDPGRLGAT